MQRVGIPKSSALILKEGTRRTKGKNARDSNIIAANILSNAMKTSLGPKGMDKLIIHTTDFYVTNDGAYMLEKMGITVKHPIAKMMIEIAKTQDDEVGDGTTTVVVLTGELLKEAKGLFDKKIHPTVVLKGYDMAERKALEIMEDIAIKADPEDKEALKNVAKVAMSSKIVSEHKDFLADLIVEAMLRAREKTQEKFDANLDDVKVLWREGGSLLDTKLVNGLVIGGEAEKMQEVWQKVARTKPKKINDAKIALIVNEIEIKKTETTSKLNIQDPKQMKAFIEEEKNQFRRAFDRLSELGVNVLFCQRNIADKALQLLADRNILAIKRVKFKDLDRLAKITEARLVPEIGELTEEDIGYAGIVEERKIGKSRGAAVGRDKILFIEDGKNRKVSTIFLRGGTKKMVYEADKAVHDALCVVRDVIKDPSIVVGGGAAEFETSRRLKKYAETIGGKEQLAISAFANALESIPATLAENAGLNSIDILTKLRANHEKGNVWYGVDPLEGEAKDLYKFGVFEPAHVKTQAITSASEAAQMILRIDDFILARSEGAPQSRHKDLEESDSEEKE